MMAPTAKVDDSLLELQLLYQECESSNYTDTPAG